jgi:hypothetical protein
MIVIVTKPSTPPTPHKLPHGVLAMRRSGSRHEVTERVALHRDDGKRLLGWALNVSRGGVRAILEEKVALGQHFEVVIGTDDGGRRASRVVWIQEEPDGVIVGLEFIGAMTSLPPPGSNKPTGA